MTVENSKSKSTATEHGPQERFQEINKRSELFTGIELSKAKEVVSKLSTTGIPESAFAPNTKDTAVFNFYVQFSLLAKEISKFEEQFDPNNLENKAGKNADRFIYWLAASLFKLNLHKAIDPFGHIEQTHAEQLAKMANAFFLVQSLNHKCVTALHACFTTLREFSTRCYKSFLMEGNPVETNQDDLLKMRNGLSDYGNFGEYLAPALMMAIGYTQVLFDVGTKKKLDDSLFISFDVEKSSEGYKKKIVTNAFIIRFSLYAGAYAFWHTIKDDETIAPVEDVGAFVETEKILLEIDNEVINVQVPTFDWLIYELQGNSPYKFALELISHAKSIGKRGRMVIFPAF